MFQLLLPETACDLWEGKSGLLTGVVDTLSDISGEDKTVIYICSLCSTSSTVLPNERVVGWLNTSSNDSSLLNLVSCSNGTVREKAVCVSLRIVKTSEGSIQMNVKFCAAIPHLGNVEFREIPDAACVIISFPLEDVQRCQFLCRSAESNMDETFPGLQRALGLSPPMDNIQTISEEVDDSFHSPIRRKVERFFLLSSFICQLKDRARQVAMVSSAISSVSPCRPLSLSVGNVLVCILLDVFAASILLRYTSLSTLTPQELLVAFLNNTNDVVEFLRNLLDWIMGVPIGLKLNEPVNQALDVIRPVLLLLLRLLLHSSFLGVTIQLSIFRDLLALATFHVYCFYVYAAKLFNIQFSALMALWRLFRGKRWNPLLQRLDPYPYQIDQLFLGTLAFTVFFFLLPTTVVYYIVFTALRLLLLILEGCLYRLQYFLNVVPIYAFWLWLMRSPKICGSVQLSLASPLPMSSSGHSESHNLILRSSLAPFPLLTSLKMTVPSVPQAPTSPALAKTIHSLFLGRIIYPL
ncbi:unnamed protein product [Cyprideis torosa]|uniref:Uncharacterized protein n=1 Tax=Cyprideis torosa TaxID=163714 RepID=A0A7R8ZMJ4_9CRUS|nr:unnamed protein product [Cyprideis torosa]CAG0885955.1 unnamed protein product [Cyprideis torosa]